MKGIVSKGMKPEDPQADLEPTAEQQQGDIENEDGENDPGFQQALQFAMSALYENGAARGIAEQVRKSQSVPEGLANAAYEIVVITDERTDGAVDDDLLMLFVTYVIEEVIDIARAAGVKVEGSDMGEAIKIMTLRWLGENGYDTTDLQSAMDKFDTKSLNTIDKVDDEEGVDGAELSAQSDEMEGGEAQ